MKSFKGPKGTTFFYWSRGEGDVEIVPAEAETDPARMLDGRVTIPGEDIKAFVADLVRTERISALEQMNDEKLLGMPPEPRPTIRTRER